jgi:imidazolonepropionase-like amidohydrolase
MSRTVFTDVSIFDGTGAAPFPGHVVVEGNKITKVAKGRDAIDTSGAEVIDGSGQTLMPGMCDCHAHLTWAYSVDRRPKGAENFLRRPPSPERLALICAHNAKVLMDHGFTSAYSAGAIMQSIEVTLRDEIDEGWIPGPRFVPAGTEGVKDDYVSTNQVREIKRSTDVDGVRHYIQHTAEIGAKVAKFIMSGPGIAFGEEYLAMYTDEQLAAAQEEADKLGIWMGGHARPLAAVKQAVKYGFRVIYHCDEIDEEVLDMMEARKHNLFIGPTPAFSGQRYENSKTEDEKTRAKFVLDHYKENARRMRKRGIMVMPGGDYGFAPIPHGDNAKDLVYFVKYMDYTPTEALVSCTKFGGEIMGMPNELGLIKEGYLADLVLVDGDPTKDISVVVNANNLTAVMKDGKFHKKPETAREGRREAAE